MSGSCGQRFATCYQSRTGVRAIHLTRALSAATVSTRSTRRQILLTALQLSNDLVSKLARNLFITIAKPHPPFHSVRARLTYILLHAPIPLASQQCQALITRFSLLHFLPLGWNLHPPRRFVLPVFDEFLLRYFLLPASTCHTILLTTILHLLFIPRSAGAAPA